MSSGKLERSNHIPKVFDLYVSKNGYLDNLDKTKVRKTLDQAYEQFQATNQAVLDNIQKNKEISNEDEAVLAKELKEFFENLNQ